jgi:uncharacterized membrane protein
MAFCGSCGTQMNDEATLCKTCGKPSSPDVVSASVLDSTAPDSTAHKANSTSATTPSSAGISPNVAGALSYLFGALSGIIFLLIDPFKSDRFVRFHAFQSIFFSLGWIGLWVVGETAMVLFEAITAGFLAVLIIPLSLIFTLGSLGYWFFLMYKAYSGQQYRIPWIGRIAGQQANR